MIRPPLILAALIGLATTASGQDLVTDVSREIVELRYDFAGTDLLLFGAVKQPPRPGRQLDVVITVTGPLRPAVIRRKDRVAGLWVNTQSATVADAPGYYALAATRPLEEIAAEAVLAREGIGPQHLQLELTGLDRNETRRRFRGGFLRRMRAANLYQIHEGDLRLAENTLFRTTVQLPANVPAGPFTARVYLFMDGRVAAQREIAISVDKTGFERGLFTFAHDYPLAYGIAAALIALLAGWIAGVAARR